MKTARKKILIADCHAETLIALEKMHAGFGTTTVWTANHALKRLDSEVFDLVLVNEYLPDWGGEDLLKVLRKRGAQMPRVVMQASAPETTDVSRLQTLGARDIVCQHAYRQVVEIVSECLVCDKKVLAVA